MPTNRLSRALARWERLNLICIDELGYEPLAETACELMFQVIADRAEKAAVIVTTNLPFGSAIGGSASGRSSDGALWPEAVLFPTEVERSSRPA
jgi:DNA replication protein DnaC